MIGDRELRLRQRIDQLLDQRDHALDELALSRRARTRLRNRIYDLKRSRDLWRTRTLRKGRTR